MSFSEWKEMKLVEVCDLITRGITPSYTDQDGVMVINQKCIRDNRINFELSRLTNPEKRKISEQKHLKSYDILVNSTGVGTLGRVAQLKKIAIPMTCDTHVTIVRPNESIHPQFLGYNLFMQQPNIENLAEGSTGQTELSRARLGEAIKINIPPLQEQKAIADILSTLDEKIEVNNVINKTLEEMAQAIFKQWFVDFEFPNENGEPYKSSGGEMVESELGMIPKGWEVKNLKDIASMKNGVNYGRDQEGTEVKVINVRDFNGSLIINDEKLDSVFLPEKQINEYLLKEFDTVVVRSAKPGETLLVVNESNKVYSGFTIRVRPNDSLLRIYMFYCIRNAMKMLNNSSNGTVFKNLNQQILGALKIIVPNDETTEKYNLIIISLLNKINASSIEILKLAEIRDTLLPKLMSGEIRIPINE